jgi:hypothetical protein
MASGDTDSSKHDKARDLTEQALEKLVEGQDGAADELIEKAKKLDQSAVEEVVDDLDEDAANRSKTA